MIKSVRDSINESLEFDPARLVLGVDFVVNLATPILGELAVNEG
jgi:hypothetical protein